MICILCSVQKYIRKSMTDILTLVFKTFSAQSGSAAGVPETPGTRSALVVGDRAVSRPVLLLAAVTAASESGHRVTFLTQRQIQELPVSLQRRVPRLDPAALKKIKFCYPRTLEELLVQVAALHESVPSSPLTPALIIVDGLEGYLSTPSSCSSSSGLDTSKQSSTAHLSALLCDTASFLSQALEKQGSGHSPCRLIGSFQPQEELKDGELVSDPVLDVLDRYFQSRCTLEQNTSYEATSGGLEQIWNIYLSRLGNTRTVCKNETVENQQEHIFQEWRLLLSPDGLMEFRRTEDMKKH